MAPIHFRKSAKLSLFSSALLGQPWNSLGSSTSTPSPSLLHQHLLKMRAFLLLLSLGAFSTRVAAIGGDAHDARVHPRHAHAVLKDGRAVAPGTKPDASACSSPSSTITSAPASSPTLVARAACASSYRGFTMITGTGTLPKPTSFVKRSARTQMLSLDGVAFRVVGPK
mgnify:FL=1